MKGGSLTKGDQKAVGRAKKQAGCQPTQNGKLARDTEIKGEFAHDNRGYDCYRANGKVNACGENNKGLRHGHDAHDRHLLQDQCQREGREKAIAVEDAKYNHCRDKHEKRNGRGRRLKKAQQAMEV